MNNHSLHIGMDKKKLVPVLLATALIFAAGGFYGGSAFAKSNARGGMMRIQGGPAGGGSNVGAPGGGGRQGGGQMGGGMRTMGGVTAGEILMKDDTSITVKLMDGGSKIVFLSGETKITKSSGGSKDDLKVGEQIVIMGQPGSDGSITATSIQLGGGLPRPAMPEPR